MAFGFEVSRSLLAAERARRLRLLAEEFTQRRAAASDQWLAVSEQQAVEIEIEQPAKRFPQFGLHRRGIIAHQESRNESQPATARPGEAVGEGECPAIADAYMQRGVVWADRSQLVRGDSGRQFLSERETLDARTTLELVQADLAATDRASECLRELLGVAEVVPVGQDYLAGRLS